VEAIFLLDDWVENNRELIGKLSTYLNKDSMEKLIQLYTLESSPELKEVLKNEIESVLGVYELRLWQSERPVIVAPSQDEIDGDIEIGTVFQGDIPVGNFKINKSFMVRHCALYAQTGHSKSTVLYHIQDQLIHRDIPFLFFDMKKDGRALLRKFKGLVVLPWHRFPWNPLRPPSGMPIKAWWANFSQICGFSFGWFVASSNYLQQHLERLYDHYEETGKLPTIFNLYASITQTTETTRRKSDYHDSVENRISTLVSIFDDVLDVEEGIPLEELFTVPCVIELHGLRPAEQNWLVEVMLSWIYFYRLYQDQRGEKLRQVIFVDECHRIFDRSKEFRQTAIEMGTPIISIFPSQFRDFGTSLVLASQQPSQVMNTVHANTLVKLVGNLSSGIDITAIAEAMGLDEELTDCIHKLKRAQWIVRMSDSYTEPFIIDTPDYQVERNVTDDEVITKLKSIFGDYLPKEKPKQKEKTSKLKVILPQLSDDAWSLLFDLNTHPFRGALKGVSNRYAALKLSARRGNSAKNELLQKRLIRDVDVPLGGHRPVKFLVLTDLAINILRNMGHDVRLWRHTGHMGFHHQLYTVLIGYSFRRAGYQTFIEKTMRNRRRIDVLVILDDKKVAIEVELGPTVDIQSKLQLLEEVDELVIVTGEETNLQKIHVNNLPQEVVIHNILDYLRWLKTNYSSNIHGNKYNKRNKTNPGLKSRNKAGKKRNKSIG
jgi:hypothetical protein